MQKCSQIWQNWCLEAFIIGGIFEEMSHPIYLYAIGILGFLLLMWIGTVYYNKGIKEK